MFRTSPQRFRIIIPRGVKPNMQINPFDPQHKKWKQASWIMMVDYMYHDDDYRVRTLRREKEIK